MLKNPNIWFAMAAFGIAAWLLVPQVITPRRPRVTGEDFRVAEYVCRETKEVFRLSATGPLLVNPKTGKATLVPAVYDTRRKVWRPGPPPDMRQAKKRS